MADLFERVAKRTDDRKAPESVQDKAAAPTSHLREHFCAVCRSPAQFGFGVSLLQGREGRWACFNHRDEVKEMRG